MKTGYTYGHKLPESGWEFADEILRLAIRDFNARAKDFDINLELIGDETTSVGEESRLYEITMGSDYSNTLEVKKEEEGLLIDSYSPDKLFSKYVGSVGRVMKTSPSDWP